MKGAMMSVQSLIDQGIDPREALRIVEHNARHPEPLSPYGWTEEWFTQVFLSMVPVRASRQEADALRHFAEWERSKGEQPQHA